MFNRNAARPFVLGFAAMLLTACQTASGPQGPSTAAPPSAPTLVQGVCGDCHAFAAPFLSPNPAAPSFAAIANRDGLDEASLKRWLIDAHNYPELMEFELSEDEAGEVAAYLVTLQRSDFKPAP